MIKFRTAKLNMVKSSFTQTPSQSNVKNMKITEKREKNEPMHFDGLKTKADRIKAGIDKTMKIYKMKRKIKPSVLR